jgi:DUF971 family protein
MEILKPDGITADRQKRIMTVNWNDGHTSEIPFSLIRNACPCAECRGGHENMGADPEPELFTAPVEDTPETRLVNVQAVGTYGVTPEWEDGHHYGIYSWNFLRKLCPCPVCREDVA